MVCALVHDSKHLFEFSSTEGWGQQGSATFPLVSIFQKQPEAFSWSQREGLNIERIIKKYCNLREFYISHFLYFQAFSFLFIFMYLSWLEVLKIFNQNFSQQIGVADRKNWRVSFKIPEDKKKKKLNMNHKHFFLVPKYFWWIHIDKLRHLIKKFRQVWAYPKILPYSFLQSMIACNCPYNGITITIINSIRQFNIKGDNVDIFLSDNYQLFKKR